MLDTMPCTHARSSFMGSRQVVVATQSRMDNMLA